jgi:hypothetical protein
MAVEETVGVIKGKTQKHNLLQPVSWVLHQRKGNGKLALTSQQIIFKGLDAIFICNIPATYNNTCFKLYVYI